MERRIDTVCRGLGFEDGEAPTEGYGGDTLVRHARDHVRRSHGAEPVQQAWRREAAQVRLRRCSYDDTFTLARRSRAAAVGWVAHGSAGSADERQPGLIAAARSGAERAWRDGYAYCCGNASAILGECGAQTRGHQRYSRATRTSLPRLTSLCYQTRKVRPVDHRYRIVGLRARVEAAAPAALASMDHGKSQTYLPTV